MIGIFLGSFDPPHIGHLSVVSECLNSGVSKVLVVPAYLNLWKPDQTPYLKRLKMVMSAFKEYGERVKVMFSEKTLFHDPRLREIYYDPEDLNLDTGVPSYALLRYLQDEIPEEDIRLITTSETFKEIGKWKKGNEIYRENKFIIVFPEHFGDQEFNLPENMITVYPRNDFRISSTLIREGIKEGRIMNEYLPGKVSSLINSMGLYKEKEIQEKAKLL
jgi:nicotinate-nucleotide adenylyltransferase